MWGVAPAASTPIGSYGCGLVVAHGVAFAAVVWQTACNEGIGFVTAGYKCLECTRFAVAIPATFYETFFVLHMMSLHSHTTHGPINREPLNKGQNVVKNGRMCPLHLTQHIVPSTGSPQTRVSAVKNVRICPLTFCPFK